MDAAARRLHLMSFRGMGKSIQNDGASIRKTDAPLIVVWMSFQLAIPRWVALQHCPPPLHQPESILLLRLSKLGDISNANEQRIALKIKTV
jgi:hypothetical protein